MIRSAKILLSLGAAVLIAGAGFAAPEKAADGKVCQAGVGKPYVMPLFANGKLVSSCEVGNGMFFKRACEMPGKSLASAKAACAGSTCDASAKTAGSACATKAAGSACATKTAASGCGEKALGKMACEVGNKHFFSAANCCSSEVKVAKAACCASKK